MECNKDEAFRAKEIAEKKFTAKDLAGAKKFVLKAQNLFPALEGITQMIATFDVYLSAENKVNGEADWYGILGVNPQADDETVRKQYRKLVLMLHPDKNKSVGADGAFKLISEAWSLLSDKTKRLAYDQKRNTKMFQKTTDAKMFQKASTPAGGPSAAPGSNVFYNVPKKNVKTHKSTPCSTHSTTPVSSHKSKPSTFWTVCHRCKMQYEYLRVYLNHNLLCPNCHEPFLAVETTPPYSSNAKPSPWSFSCQQQNRGHQTSSENSLNSGRNGSASSTLGAGGFNGQDSLNQSNFQWGLFSGTGNATTATHTATTREEVLKWKNQSSKRDGGVSSSGQSNSAKRRRGVEDIDMRSYRSDVAYQMGTGSGGVGTSSGPGIKLDNFDSGRVNGITRPYGSRDLSQFGTQAVLVEKAKKGIREKLKEWDLATAINSTTKVYMVNKKTNDGLQKSSTNSHLPNQSDFDQPMKTGNGFDGNKSSSGTSETKVDAEPRESMIINVPDPDFHDFDKDRTETCFDANQIWAAYDDNDGMPRYYGMIHSIISLNPFKMKISWLTSNGNNELGPLNWVGSGFPKSCGDFRVGRNEIYSLFNSFSHRVRWTKGTRGVIRIYPRKGDVWALYRNWSPDWNELTTDEVIHKYDMVEVVEDYSEEHGVTVIPLIKVAGFKTVFHQHLDSREVRRIPREEMFRFSHHVPSYLLTGEEGPNAPKGCWELDPAAIPSDLLHVIIDVKDEETMEGESNSKEEKVVDDLENVNERVTESEKCRDNERDNFEANEVKSAEETTKSKEDSELSRKDS
ncbi:hypothetical protein K2173_003283 [Erythroxylum novogranatense]|uniref:J domain-containing protein n=1 Tax=Erythroxylum novogranatense TaxID=1862640 RepID=A0AAV8SYG7_9ROSI|nr:hypothetical protein K2173_003283 [Erythroxylum novogranatense]